MRLPENEVTLSAYTIPDEKTSNDHYSYVWKLVDQPKSGFTGKILMKFTYTIQYDGLRVNFFVVVLYSALLQVILSLVNLKNIFHLYKFLAYFFFNFM